MPQGFGQKKVKFPYGTGQQGYFGGGFGQQGYYDGMGHHGGYGGGMGYPHYSGGGYGGGMGYPHYSGGGYGGGMGYPHYSGGGYGGGMGYPHYSGGGHGHFMPYQPGYHVGTHGSFPHHGWQGQQWGQDSYHGQYGYGEESHTRDPYSFDEFDTFNPYFQ